ncbi:MAG: hypothetical protein ACOC1F_13065 [Myxococcota bacterium]
MRKPFQESELFKALERQLGVRFHFEDVRYPSSELSPDDVRGRFGSLSDDLRTSFVSAVELSVERVANLLSRVRGHDPSLADALEPFVNDFAHDELLGFLR